VRVRRTVASVAAAVMVASGVMLAVAPVASAASDSTLSVTVTDSDPVFDASAYCGEDSGSFFYTTRSVTVSESGDYDVVDTRIGESPIDGCLYIYPSGSFNPASPGDNLVGFVDDDDTLTVDAGAYTMVFSTYDIGNTGLVEYLITGPGTWTMSSDEATPEQPRSIWYQAVGRGSADEACPDGYTAGWAEWPNSGTGGFVCNRALFDFGDGTPPQ
jgi:hypothetical protein